MSEGEDPRRKFTRSFSDKKLKKVKKIHSTSSTPDFPPFHLHKDALHSGYLFVKLPKKSKSKRCWCAVCPTSFICYDEKIPGEPFLSLDLLGGAVKSSSDRPKEFQIFTVSDSAMFSCDSKTDTDSWLQLLNGVCEKLVLKSIHGDQSSKEKSDVCSESANENRNKLLELMKFDGNNVCADCNFPDPDWASINLGIFICLECSGVHRSLGSHMSKVRSVQLDDWPDEAVKGMKKVGNNRSNLIFEKFLTDDIPKPTEGSTRDERETFIRFKYERRAFVSKTALQSALPASPRTPNLSSSPKTPRLLYQQHPSTPVQNLGSFSERGEYKKNSAEDEAFKIWFLRLLRNDSDFRDDVKQILNEASPPSKSSKKKDRPLGGVYNIEGGGRESQPFFFMKNKSEPRKDKDRRNSISGTKIPRLFGSSNSGSEKTEKNIERSPAIGSKLKKSEILPSSTDELDENSLLTLTDSSGTDSHYIVGVVELPDDSPSTSTSSIRFEISKSPLRKRRPSQISEPQISHNGKTPKSARASWSSPHSTITRPSSQTDIDSGSSLPIPTLSVSPSDSATNATEKTSPIPRGKIPKRASSGKLSPIRFDDEEKKEQKEKEKSSKKKQGAKERIGKKDQTGSMTNVTNLYQEETQEKRKSQEIREWEDPPP